MSAGYWDSLERHDSFIKLCRDILPEYLTDDKDQYNCDDFPYDTMAGVNSVCSDGSFVYSL